MNKKGKRGFKMKGFSPFSGKSSSPMKNIMEGVEDDPASYTFTERELRGYTPRGMSGAEKRALRKARKEEYNRRRQERQEKFRETQGYQNMAARYAAGEESYHSEAYDAGKADADGDGYVSNNEHRTYMESQRGKVNPGRRSIADRQARGSYYDPNSLPAYHKMQTPVDDLTARERRLIERSGGGINAEIPKEVLRGLDPGTHEGRRRVSRVNAYYEFNDKLQRGVLQSPEQYKAAYHQYQEKLSAMLDPRSTTNVISQYDNYDEFGRPHKEKIEEYKRHKRHAIGVDAKTGRYILPDTSNTTEGQIAELREYNRMKAYEDRATSLSDLRARQKADKEASDLRHEEAKKRARKRRR